MENLNLVLPEIFISLSIMFLLVLGVFKNDSSKIIFNISLLVLLIASIITLNETFSIDRVTLFNNSLVIDHMSSLMKIITLIGAFLVLVISSAYLKSFKIFKIEYPVLILSSVLGMMVMISSNDLMVFYMGLELQSLALYVLATFNRDQLKSSEAGLKYFVLSALSSGLLLYGCSLIYGFSGSTNFNVISSQLNSNEYVLTFGIVFILVGLAFKISAVPFHMWAPDVYEGSPTSVTLFFTMVPKIAALNGVYKIFICTFFKYDRSMANDY
jgi:NADH-quinone oxidoreductase subunit N